MLVLMSRLMMLMVTSCIFCVSSAYADEQFITNGILTVYYEDGTGQFTAAGHVGQFTIKTDLNHPNPYNTVFFSTGTSYITLRDDSDSTMWVNRIDLPVSGSGLAGYSTSLMNTQPSAVIALSPTEFQTTYTLPNFTVIQNVVINGTTLADTNVRHSVTITNTTGQSLQYGLRNLWDWQIAGNDGSFFRQRNSDTAFTNEFATFLAPSFSRYEMVDDTSSPTFSVFGTVSGGSLSPAPTLPDQVRYSSWNNSEKSAWDFTNTGSAVDSAVVYYWGYNTPLTLTAGGSSTFTQYVSTELAALGAVSPPPPPPPALVTGIPTLSEWAMIMLAMSLGLLGVRQMHRSARNLGRYS